MGNEKIFFICFFFLFLSTSTNHLTWAQEEGEKPVFSPTLTATCHQREDRMVITLVTDAPFRGLLTSSTHSNSTHCSTLGSGSTHTTLSLSLSAPYSSASYCGVSTKTSEKSVLISVRQNPIIQLADDKNYLVSCGRFESPAPLKNQPATMGLYDARGRRAIEVVKGSAYTLRVESNAQEGKMFRVRNCFAFAEGGSTARFGLVDEAGCPESKVVGGWKYQQKVAEAGVASMFRFGDSRVMTLQCSLLFCDDNCPTPPQCPEAPAPYVIGSNNPQPNRLAANSTDAYVSTTVTVIEPGEKEPLLYHDDDVCTGRFCPTWLLWLCIALGVLFLLMLLINLFLCTALTCTCTRTELVEKEPSIVEDYDPYAYSSRGGGGYNKSYSDITDHYSSPNNKMEPFSSSRPNSRY
jgi:hypothetical protein